MFWSYFLEGLIYLLLFIGVDILAEKYKIEGRYYLSHTICNLFITILTYHDLIHTYFNFSNFINYPMNYRAATLTFSLHYYHIIWYFKKLRFDDWLHHILTVIVALPLTMFTPTGSLLGHSLFYLCGLPGGIDYLMLFLNRNNYITRLTEKQINNCLNLWIRCPGCIAHSTLTLVGYNMLDSSTLSTYDKYTSFTTAVIVFWNGIYFMNQVVVNYAITNNIKISKIESENLTKQKKLLEPKTPPGSGPSQ